MARRYASKGQRKKFAPYDSMFEKYLAEGILKGIEYHPVKIRYTKPETSHLYEPDFKITEDTLSIYIEAKGRFESVEEATKYLHIKDCIDDGELVFLFMNPYLPMPGAKKRKDGTVRTHGEWASKSGFKWYTEHTIQEVLLK